MRFLSALIIALFVFSCSENKTYSIIKKDNIEIINNSGKPANSKLAFEFIKKMEIPLNNVGKDQQTAIVRAGFPSMDKNKHIYITDFAKNIVYQFDSSGIFLKTFCNEGDGPGEMRKITGFSVIKNNIYLSDMNNRKISIHDLNGNFIKSIILDKNGLFYLKEFSNKLIGFSSSITVKNDAPEHMHINSFFSVYDSDLKQISNFDERDKKIPIVDFSLLEILQPSEIIDNFLYLPLINKEKYQIDVYDRNFIKVKVITKNYNKTSLSSDELQKLKKSIKNEVSSSDKKKSNSYAYAITYLAKDKYSNIWVLNSNEKSQRDQIARFDIFEKQGVLLSSVENFPTNNISKEDALSVLNFIGDYILFIDREKNVLEVYSYSMIK